MNEINNLKKIEAECCKNHILKLLPYAAKCVEDEDFEKALDCVTTAMNDIVTAIRLSLEAKNMNEFDLKETTKN